MLASVKGKIRKQHFLNKIATYTLSVKIYFDMTSESRNSGGRADIYF
jgi:hypothetical protein